MEYIIIGILIVILVLVVMYVIIERNNLVQLNNKVQEAFSTMDVYLKKRWDLVPNLVSNVKGYAKHEEETFEKVTAIRSGNYNDLKQDEKIDTNLKLEEGLSNFSAIIENYPTLKADTSFLELNENLNKIEEDIANSRKYYNAVVRMYNNKVEMFPSNMIANMFNFKCKKMFETGSDERKNVNINLGK